LPNRCRPGSSRKRFPRFKSLDYAGICIQARHVGGDYYDFLALGQERLGLLIGDISGKGIAAALLMANLQANLRSQFALAREQPRLLLQSVNRLFYQNTVDSAYATFFLPTTTTVRSACATRTAGICRRFCCVTTALWKDSTPPARFWVYSRIGTARQRNANSTRRHARALHRWRNRIMFNAAGRGVRRAAPDRGIAAARELSAHRLLAFVVEEIQKFSPHEQHDDITLIVAKCT
jgi:hypothetical protein